MRGAFSMGKIQKTYDVNFKKQAVDLYLKGEMSYEAIGKKLNVHGTAISRWVKHYQNEGLAGLEEKRGKAKGNGKGPKRTRPEDPEAKIKRLEAENEMLKKLLKM
jgi:transposase